MEGGTQSHPCSHRLCLPAVFRLAGAGAGECGSRAASRRLVQYHKHAMTAPKTKMAIVGVLGTKKLDSGCALEVELTDFPDRDWVQGVRANEEAA